MAPDCVAGPAVAAWRPAADIFDFIVVLLLEIEAKA